MRAILDRVIVKRTPSPTQSGRILLAGQEQPDSGTVVSVGPGAYANDGSRIPVGVSVNDLIYFNKLSGQELVENGERYVVLTPASIIAVAEPDPPAAQAFQSAVADLCSMRGYATGLSGSYGGTAD